MVSMDFYLVNRSPMLALIEKTSMEICLEKNPSLRHLEVFYCKVYAHMLRKKRSNLKNKDIKCISIGYSVGLKEYKIWDLVVEIFFYRKFIIFREVKSYFIVLQPKKDRKKGVVQLTPKTKKVELEALERPKEEESLDYLERYEKEIEPPP